MSDFFQNGTISTLNRLQSDILPDLEGELVQFTEGNPVALVLPCLASEMDGGALPKIIQHLRGAEYIDEIVVALGRASGQDYLRAVNYFSVLPQRKRVLWVESPPMGDLMRELILNDLNPGAEGKGRAVWMAYGYILSEGRAKNIVLHDCDIVTYDRELLARLCYPLVNPALSFEFCKGFYSRVTDRLHGRVTRLLVTPLLRALKLILGTLPFLEYMDSFRYPLAGEFSMTVDLAQVNRVPSDWSLEVETLAEVFRNCSMKRICQVELCENYDHKHQALSSSDSSQGLLKMSVDITKAIFRTLRIEEVSFSEEFLKALRVDYLKIAQEHIDHYSASAAINQLNFDKHDEELVVKTFTDAIEIAGSEFCNDPTRDKPMPNWNRVISEIPDIFERINATVTESEKIAEVT